MKRFGLFFVLVMAANSARADAPKVHSEVMCPPGQHATDATKGHCCWPGQTWPDVECVGAPTQCPPGMEVQGDACLLSMKSSEKPEASGPTNRCAPGEKATEATKGHCCWPGQSWGLTQHFCIGVPTECPRGREVVGEQCVQAATKRQVEPVSTGPVKAAKEEMFTGVAAKEKLPAQLSNMDVVRAMRKLDANLHDCKVKHNVSGSATVMVVLEGNGTIQSASVGGVLAGTPGGDCIVAVARTAQFPHFTGREMAIHYPVVLK